jgi:hypothetical protein
MSCKYRGISETGEKNVTEGWNELPSSAGFRNKGPSKRKMTVEWTQPSREQRRRGLTLNGSEEERLEKDKKKEVYR